MSCPSKPERFTNAAQSIFFFSCVQSDKFNRRLCPSDRLPYVNYISFGLASSKVKENSPDANPFAGSVLFIFGILESVKNDATAAASLPASSLAIIVILWLPAFREIFFWQIPPTRLVQRTVSFGFSSRKSM